MSPESLRIPGNKLPITVGIIGHLDAVITDDHIRIITRFFDDVQEKYPASPVCLFSQLAEGADMRVAELFLELKARTSRSYYLIVPIPFSLPRYITRFDTRQRAQFDRLLSQSSRHFVLENTGNCTPEEQYRCGGQFVADSSILLLALWDLEVNDKKGGTSEIVKYKEQGSFTDTDVDQMFEKKGVCLSLYCQRSQAPDGNLRLSPRQAPSPHFSPATRLLSSIHPRSSIHKALDKIEHINITSGKIAPSKRKESEEQLFSEPSKLSRSNQLLLSYYSQTDTLAAYNRKAYLNMLNILFLLGLVIIGVFEWYKHILHTTLSLLLVLGCIFSAFVLNYLSRRWKNHLRFLEDRVLCEAMRVQFFWNITHVNKNVARHILRIYKAEFNWIKDILFAINGVTHQHEPDPIPIGLAKEYWVVDQFNYFEKKTEKIARIKKRMEWLSWTGLGISLTLMLYLVFFKEYITEYQRDYLIVFIGLFLGIFALAKAYIEKRGFHQLINQYALMREIFKTTLFKIDQLEKKPFAEEGQRREWIKNIYCLAGKEALIENGNWYLIFKDKETEPEGF